MLTFLTHVTNPGLNITTKRHTFVPRWRLIMITLDYNFLLLSLLYHGTAAFFMTVGCSVGVLVQGACWTGALGEGTGVPLGVMMEGGIGGADDAVAHMKHCRGNRT